MGDPQPPESTITTKDAIIKQACQMCQMRIKGTRNPSDYLAFIQRPSHHHHHHCPLCFGIFSILLNSPPPSSPSNPIKVGASQHCGIISALQAALNGWRLNPSSSSSSVLNSTTDSAATPVPIALDIFLPASLAIRSHAFTLLPSSSSSSSETTTSTSLKNSVGIKEAVKFLINAVVVSSNNNMNSGGDTSTPPGLDSNITIVGDAPLKLLLSIEHTESASEASWLVKDPKPSRKRRYEWKKHQKNNTTNDNDNDTIQQAILHNRQPSFATASAQLLTNLSSMDSSQFLQQCPTTAAHLSLPQTPVKLSLLMTRKPVYIGGRYYKTIRNIPQSPWFLDGERKGDTSVSEEIEKVVLSTLHVGSGSGSGGTTSTNNSTFLSAGREDIDVRMLGSGRPFALELKDAKLWPPTTDECSLMENAINQSTSGIEISNLRIFTADDIKLIKHGESDKAKRYAAVCWLPHRPVSDADITAINTAGTVVLKQKTPVRVLHRRANLERETVVDELYAEKIKGQEHYFVLKMRTAAGTYVKEFVHGDFRRTQPSLGDILSLGQGGGGRGGKNQVEIISLDVLGIDMEGL